MSNIEKKMKDVERVFSLTFYWVGMEYWISDTMA